MIPLNIGHTYRVIRTEAGFLPGYADYDNAPGGSHADPVPEGEVVRLLRHPNPRGYVAVEYKGRYVVIDGEGHLEPVTDTEPAPEPTPEPTPEPMPETEPESESVSLSVRIVGLRWDNGLIIDIEEVE